MRKTLSITFLVVLILVPGSLFSRPAAQDNNILKIADRMNAGYASADLLSYRKYVGRGVTQVVFMSGEDRYSIRLISRGLLATLVFTKRATDENGNESLKMFTSDFFGDVIQGSILADEGKLEKESKTFKSHPDENTGSEHKEYWQKELDDAIARTVKFYNIQESKTAKKLVNSREWDGTLDVESMMFNNPDVVFYLESGKAIRVRATKETVTIKPQGESHPNGNESPMSFIYEMSTIYYTKSLNANVRPHEITYKGGKVNFVKVERSCKECESLVVKVETTKRLFRLVLKKSRPHKEYPEYKILQYAVQSTH